MIRVSTLLKPETLEKVQEEATEKSISAAAIIRQKVEQAYSDYDDCEHTFEQKGHELRYKCKKCGFIKWQ